MRETSLPSPGLLSNGFLIRREAAKAISAVEIATSRTPGGKTQGAAKLQAFFTACAAALASKVDAVLPTNTARTRVSGTAATLTFSEPMDQTVVPDMSSFASPGNTVTSAAWQSATVLGLTGTGFAVADTITYTPPAVSYLRDLAGNAVATFTGTFA